MEVILDELHEQGIDIDMKTLSHTINGLLEKHRPLYDQMIMNINHNEIRDVFNEIIVNSYGRAMAYLTLVYLMNTSEEIKRKAVRLVTVPLRGLNLSVYQLEKRSIFNRMISLIWP
jgi:hypothetical protein